MIYIFYRVSMTHYEEVFLLFYDNKTLAVFPGNY